MATIVFNHSTLTSSEPRSITPIGFDFLSTQTSQSNFCSGEGFLSGGLPDYFARLSTGAPAQDVTVELYLKGTKIKEYVTGSDGSWIFKNLDHRVQYDIVAKHPTLEAIISTKRYPKLLLQSTPINVTRTVGSDFSRKFVLSGGFAPYAVDVLGQSITYTINQEFGIIELTATKIATEENYDVVFSCDGGLNYVVQVFTVPSL